MRVKVFICLAFVPIILAQYPNTPDKTSNEDKTKLRTLAHELLAEAKLKIHQTDEIRDRLSNQIGFQIGMIVGQIREKYKYMLEIYRQTTNKYTEKSKIIMPSILKRLPIHYFVRTFAWDCVSSTFLIDTYMQATIPQRQLEIIIGLEIDIERLIDVLLNIPDYMLKTPSFGHGPPPPDDGSGYPPTEPPGNVKRKMRQEYLLRKLNLPTNSSTTKKRFYKKWPVEETWSLEKMNY